MKFLEHIEKIDEILLHRNEEKYKKNLFQSQGTFGVGMNFTHINTMQNGNMTNINVSSNGNINRYTVFNEAAGISVFGPGF